MYMIIAIGKPVATEVKVFPGGWHGKCDCGMEVLVVLKIILISDENLVMQVMVYRSCLGSGTMTTS